MKRAAYKVLCLLLAYCILLTGCTAPTPEREPIEVGALQYLPSHYVENYPGFAGNEEGYYYFEYILDSEAGKSYKLLVYLNYEDESYTVLCNKPSCAHNDETCEAYFSAWSYITPLVLNNKLYLFHHVFYNNVPPFEALGNSHIDEYSLNGVYLKTVTDFPITQLVTDSFAFDAERNTLYGIYWEEDDAGVRSYILFSINLNTTEYKVIKEFLDIRYISLVYAFDDKLLFEINDYESLDTLIETQERHYELYTISTGESLTYFDNSVYLHDYIGHYGFYFRNNDTDVIQVDLVTGEEHVIFTPQFLDIPTNEIPFIYLASSPDGETLRIHSSFLNGNKRTFLYHLYDPATGEITEYTPMLFYPNTTIPIDVIAANSTHYLIMLDPSLLVKGYSPYALLSKEDYHAGERNYIYLPAYQ